MKAEVTGDIRAIFNTANQYVAQALLAKMAQKYEKKASLLADWMETNIPEGLTVFAFPAAHGRHL